MIADDVHPWDRSLAEIVGLPVVPTYGSRYVDTSWSSHRRWMCRSCGAEVTDRYSHELEHRQESWVSHVDRLYEIVVELFAERESKFFMGEKIGAVNGYACGDEHETWTRNVDEGTTPMMIRCTAPECQLSAQSRWYRVDQATPVTHEWYRPDKEEMRTLSRSARAHVARGGLMLRKITDR